MMPNARDLEEVFRRIELERMKDIPILNRKLRVEAVGFSDWQGYPLGVLITPWFMNLVWLSESISEKSIVKFPSGELGFSAFFDPELGRFQSCSMFSPMSDFPGQDFARETAREILRHLFTEEKGCSRRDFLRGDFGRGGA